MISFRAQTNWFRYKQSQAIKAGNFVWLSGQIPADVNGTLVEGSIEEKTRVIVQNAEAILQEAGSRLDHVVKVVVRTLPHATI